MLTLTALALALSMSLQGGLDYIKPPSEIEALPAVSDEQAAEALNSVSFEGGFGALALRYPEGGERLLVYPAGFSSAAEIGQWLQFRVFLDGKELSYKDYTCELASGEDCAAVYFTGEILALGEGEASVRVWLDADESVRGVSAPVKITPPSVPNKYTSVTGCPTAAEASNAEFEGGIEDFPESYKPYLRLWHEFYGEWAFEPIETGIDFWDAVEIQSGGARNVTLLANFADLLKSRDYGDYDRESREYILKDTGWVETTELAVSYYLDPRNALADYGIFQHEALGYDGDFHTKAGVESIIAGTFMANADTDYLDADGELVKTGVSYADTIMSAARETGVNPYYLAAKIRGEIGAAKSRSVSGDVEGHEGYYNYYNIGATDGEGNVERALEYAAGEGSYGRPWNSPERAIAGGARFLAGDYIASGQDTGYLQKWNVAPYTTTARHLHQYMTNVSGALAQSFSAYSGYADIGLLETPIEFAIPVFENMPANTAASLADAAGRGQFGAVRGRAFIRSAPRESAGIIAQTDFGALVEIIEAAPTDAAYYHARLFAPYWYLVSYTDAGGAVHEGYISEDFVRVAADYLLETGETAGMNVTALPSGCGDDVRYITRNAAVAGVDSDGTIYAEGAGCAEIVAYTANGCFFVRSVIVTE